MPIFIDSSALDPIEQFHSMGVIRGVTTNPTIMLRDGITSAREMEDRAKEIARLVDPLSVSVEVTTNNQSEMLDQARMLSSWAKNIVVKVTIHGPEGELHNLEVIHELETRDDVRVNVTALMSAQQGLLAALAGATYVSIFGGRVADMGHNASDEIARLRNLLDEHDLPARIIVGSTRETANVLEWLEAGAHIVTVQPEFLGKLLVHPYSKETVRQFLSDAEAVHASQAAALTAGS
jgi:transaldolase